MQEISYNQLIDDANKGNGFAIAWLGVYLIDIVGDVKEALPGYDVQVTIDNDISDQ